MFQDSIRDVSVKRDVSLPNYFAGWSLSQTRPNNVVLWCRTSDREPQGRKRLRFLNSAKENFRGGTASHIRIMHMHMQSFSFDCHE